MLPSLVFVWILSLITTSVALPSSSLAPRALCLWPAGTGVHQCEPILEDQVWSGIDFSIWRGVDIDANSPYIPYAINALREAAALYASFLNGRPLEVKTYLVPRIGDETTLGVTVTAIACHVHLNMGLAPSHSENSFKNTAAHELYHCIQGQLSRVQVGLNPFETWWIEGTATFMANFFYPDHAAEDGQIQYYNPRLAINDPANLYPATIFFQHLYNSGWTPRQINEWMDKQTWRPTAEGELSRLADDETMVTAWPGFASRFIDKGLVFADGQPVNTVHTLVPEFIAVTEGPLFTKKISVFPFQINTYETLFAADKAVSMTWTPEEPGDEKTVLQCRKGTSGHWITARPGVQVVLQNDCASERDSWYFIVTSTNDVTKNTIIRDGQSHGTLSFSITTPQRKRQECQPPTALDTCLIGNWALENEAMAEYLSKHVSTSFTSTVGAVISNLAVTGLATLSITDAFISKMLFQAFSIGYDVAGADFPAFHTDIVIDGSSEGLIVPGTNASTFTWTDAVVATGTTKINTIIPSLDLEIPLETSLDGQYGINTVVQYTCSGDKLEMAGYTDGIYAWAYTWRRASN